MSTSVPGKSAEALLCVCGGLLCLVLVLQGVLPWVFALLCLLPLYHALERSSAKQALLLAALWYVMLHAVFLYGLVQIREFGSVAFVLLFVLALFGVGLLLFSPLLLRKCNRVVVFNAVLLASTLVGSSFTLLGSYANPVSLGYLLTDSPLVRLGLHHLTLLSLCVLLTNQALYLLLRRRAAPVAFAVLLVLAFQWKPAVALQPTASPRTLQVRIIQPGIYHRRRERAYVDPAAKAENLKFIGQLLAGHERVDFTLLGEAALPGILELGDSYTDLGSPAPLLAGAVVRDFDRFYSSVVAVENSALDLLYTKQSLIPWLETKWLSTQDLEPLYTLPGKHVRIGLLICKDALYPEVLLRVMEHGPDLIVVFMNTDLPLGVEMQIRAIRMRAIEAHRTLIVVNQSGGSTVIDAQGRVQSTLGWHGEYVRVVSVNY